jgi:hypothetical protein
MAPLCGPKCRGVAFPTLPVEDRAEVLISRLICDTKGPQMFPNVRRLFWIEAALSAFCGVLAVVTIFWQDWIEALTGYDPDQHDGSVEWLIVVALFVVCGILALAARVEWRRPRPAIAKP